ncbi:sugar transferase [Rhodopirellula sp. JC639]|uniref:sugar transferase n=1 Tax=Stieleria mannarensis TaxID=2755585 RepID=UPI00336A29E3
MFEFNDSDSDSSVAIKSSEPASHGSRSVVYASHESDTANCQSRPRRSPRVSPAHPVYFPIKHCCERLFAACLLILVSPLILVLIALVRLTSKGPGIYRQERVGLNRCTFDVFKLRTMYQDAEADGQAKWSQKGDPRITSLGRFLRRTHLDELPQLWNVVTGDMSLTGPRPERPCICEKLAGHIRGYYARTNVKPGITGVAQINLEPDRTINDVRRKQCLDLHYIENANAWLDLRMVFATVLRMFGIRGAVVTRWMGLCRKDVLEAAGLSESERHGSRTIESLPSLKPSDATQEFEAMVAVQVPEFETKSGATRSLRIDRKSTPK